MQIITVGSQPEVLKVAELSANSYLLMWPWRECTCDRDEASISLNSWMRVFSILFCWRLNHWHINDFRRNVLHNRYCRLSIHKIYQRDWNYCGQLYDLITILNTETTVICMLMFLGSGKSGLVTVYLSLEVLYTCQPETMSEKMEPLQSGDPLVLTQPPGRGINSPTTPWHGQRRCSAIFQFNYGMWFLDTNLSRSAFCILFCL